MERADMADFLRGLSHVAAINAEEAAALQDVARWIDEQEGEEEEEMGEARDTQFAGFAADTWAAINDVYAHCLERNPRMDSRELHKKMETIIARRAYDLVLHAFSKVPHLVERQDIQTLQEAVAEVPDLTAARHLTQTIAEVLTRHLGEPA